MNTTNPLREGFIGAQFKRINQNLLLAPIALLALTLGRVAMRGFNYPEPYLR